jgi:hypothetical protein
MPKCGCRDQPVTIKWKVRFPAPFDDGDCADCGSFPTTYEVQLQVPEADCSFYETLFFTVACDWNLIIWIYLTHTTDEFYDISLIFKDDSSSKSVTYLVLFPEILAASGA